MPRRIPLTTASLWAGLRWRLRPLVDSVGDLFEHYGPERRVLARRFRRVHGRRIDWRNPTLFNEKSYWITHHMRSPIMPRLADKYAVRGSSGSAFGHAM